MKKITDNELALKLYEAEDYNILAKELGCATGYLYHIMTGRKRSSVKEILMEWEEEAGREAKRLIKRNAVKLVQNQINRASKMDESGRKANEYLLDKIMPSLTQIDQTIGIKQSDDSILKRFEEMSNGATGVPAGFRFNPSPPSQN